MTTVRAGTEPVLDQARPGGRPEAGLLLAALAAACVALWLAPLRSSLTIDEAGTFWVIKDGLGTAFRRALDVQGQSPLFYVLDWVSLKVFGHSEVALRLPAVAALVACLVPLRRLAVRLFDSQTATVSALAFAATGAVAFAAVDARPYALALLTSTTATLMLVRHLDANGRRSRVLYAGFAALTVYVHYLYAVAFIAHLAYAAIRGREAFRRTAGSLALAGLACLPLAPQFLALLRRSSGLAWSGNTDLLHFGLALRVPVLLFAGGVVVIAARRHGSRLLTTAGGAVLAVALVTSLTSVRIVTVTPLLRRLEDAPALAALGLFAVAAGVVLAKRHARRLDPRPALRERRDALVLVTAWAILPPLVTFAVAMSSSVEIFAPRYYLSAAPGAALLAAWAIRSAGPRALRLALAASLTVAAFAGASTTHSPDDWQAARRIVNASVAGDGEPVLVSAGFVESNDPAAFADPGVTGFLLSPVAFYPMRGDVIAMPFDPTHDAAGYVEQVARRIDGLPAFVVVTNKLHLLHGILERRLPEYEMETIGRLGWIRVTRFTHR